MASDELIEEIRGYITNYLGDPENIKTRVELNRIFSSHNDDEDVGSFAERFLEYERALHTYNYANEELDKSRVNLNRLLHNL